MSDLDYTVTFACYNAVDYTEKCINSMVANGLDLNKLVVVDNCSTDNTINYLKSLPNSIRIYNKSNLSCGVAWNQGALARQSEWTIIMNNDVIVSNDWIENLINTAIKNNLRVISPALVEKELDYDFETFSMNTVKSMKNVIRIGDRHLVCLAIHASVWQEVGYFQPVPKLLGYEDTLFFHELDKANIKTGITGASWLHHFGSITQKLMKQEKGLSKLKNLPDRYNYRLLKMSWFDRKINKIKRRNRMKEWYRIEMEKYGMTLRGERDAGKFIWF